MDKKSFENFKPLDFIQLSEYMIEILNNKPQENSSLERTIFGRIYYGTFLYVREILSEKTSFNVKNTGVDHRNIPRYIKKERPFKDDMNNNLIPDELSKLRKLRNQSYYYLTYNPPQSKNWINETVEHALDLANDIINAFNELK